MDWVVLALILTQVGILKRGYVRRGDGREIPGECGVRTNISYRIIVGWIIKSPLDHD